MFAALNVLDGTVIGRNMQRHRHQEFMRFLNAVEAHVPAGKIIHAIVDNYAVHKHPKVRQWLTRHPRWAVRRQQAADILAEVGRRDMARKVHDSYAAFQSRIAPWLRISLQAVLEAREP